MQRSDVVIIGAGQAGLAMSYCLRQLGIDHVLLERGGVAERWRSEAWDSLRLLTPNWMTRLPGATFAGQDPDGFMPARALADHLGAYAASFGAPVACATAVESVRLTNGGYHVTTSGGEWRARAVVIATGDCQRPLIPPIARGLPPDVLQMSPAGYRNPAALPAGDVLVVGASASGVQIADEIRACGREVVLAVGRHTRVPRRYRDHDIMAWMDSVGILARRAETVPDLARARRQPSLQLLGGPDGRAVDLPALRARGVRLAGRVAAIDGRSIHFADDLAATTREADAKMERLLAAIDRFAAPVVGALAGARAAAERPASSVVEQPTRRVEAGPGGIRTVIWATGYRRDYPWLDVPVRDPHGEIAHAGGITPAPGLYVLGLRFLRRRNSSFIDGVGRDAEEIGDHIALHLRLRRRFAA